MTPMDILFQCWHDSDDVEPSNKTIIKAMEVYAEIYHQSKLNQLKDK